MKRGPNKLAVNLIESRSLFDQILSDIDMVMKSMTTGACTMQLCGFKINVQIQEDILILKYF